MRAGQGASSKEKHKTSFIQQVLSVCYRPGTVLGTVLNNHIIEKSVLKSAQ